ncbi:MAG TPA: 23S rRNA (pseudouridine(1915)-N(3))-methyltransferase RlmH [Desulfatiglandales bacterium]|nr:23S rRNA (pseudouridine(1915)-N(3))-methyltransferase RlmH [Desulfatiglandales bacterium]
MLKIRFIVVDRTRSPFLREGEAHYLERLKKYARIEWIEVKPARIIKGRSEQEILDTEGRDITKRLDSGDYLIALDLSGKQYDSEGLASWLKDLRTGIRGKVCFVVGGPVGLSKEILDQADAILSLSRLTLTHEMSRLFLIEQLYRAFTIIEGHKYHR